LLRHIRQIVALHRAERPQHRLMRKRPPCLGAGKDELALADDQNLLEDLDRPLDQWNAVFLAASWCLPAIPSPNPSSTAGQKEQPIRSGELPPARFRRQQIDQEEVAGASTGLSPYDAGPTRPTNSVGSRAE
jgi:hypothetical protein